jgi:Protein of unknown function (DUF2924)
VTIMVRRRFDLSALRDEIAQWRDLDLSALRERWGKSHGSPTPKTVRRDMLIRSLAYRFQAEALGGLKRSTKRQLRQILDATRAGSEMPVASSPRIKAGTKLIRVWQDKTHIVTVLADGFEWNGSRYRSLSEIARSMTGTRWNGLVFFGVKPRPSDSKNRQREAADA